MISGRKMICLVISRCVSVSCKLMSVVILSSRVTRQSRKRSLPFSSTSLVNCMSVFCSLRCWWNASIRRVVRW